VAATLGEARILRSRRVVDSGSVWTSRREGYWEEQCDTAVKKCGWIDLKDSGWRSTYWHPREKALLVIYVDDFNMSAPVKAHDRLWADLMKRLNLEKPSEPDRCLGCYKRSFNCQARDLEMILKNKPELYPRGKSQAEEGDPPPLSSLKEYRTDTPVRGYMYGMEEYLTQNVERYLKDTKCKSH
jgi:hypothetical protein